MEKKPQETDLGPWGIERSVVYPPGGFPRPKSSSKTTLISQRQSVAALEQFRSCSIAISVAAPASKGAVITAVVRLSNVASECLLPQSIFALYQREARLRDSRSLREDSRSLREDSRSLCERERSVVRLMFAESGSKNRLSQASQR